MASHRKLSVRADRISTAIALAILAGGLALSSDIRYRVYLVLGGVFLFIVCLAFVVSRFRRRRERGRPES